MKRIIISIAALVLSAGFISAQDLAAATDIYNNAVAAYSTGEKVKALGTFREALAAATALGDEGKDIVDNCKTSIPKLALSIAKDLIQEKKYEAAVSALEEALKAGQEFEDADVVEQAQTLIPKSLIQQAKGLIALKNYDGAAEICKKVLAANEKDGLAALYLGQSLSAAGKADEAIEAFKQAAANGQASVADKQIATIFLKKASAALKAHDLENAMAAALESNQYNESATAYKIAGTAATSLQKKEEAVNYLSKYLEMSPKAPDAAQIKEAIEALKK